MKPTVTRFERAAREGWDAAWVYEARLVAAYSALLKQAADQAADALPGVALAAAGAGKAGSAPRWSKPHEEELGNQLRAVYATDKKTGPIRVEAMRAATTAPLQIIGLNFSLRNPFIQGVLLHAGKSIDVVETTRRDLMEILNASWEKGDSIPNAAKALRAYGLDNTRATLIARTELIAIANGGSHAAALTSAQASDAQPGFDGLPPLLKIWLTAEDDKVRDTHIDAGATYSDGNGIPLDQPFYVGDDELQYPGDPDGSAEEICNCRCAISYEEATLIASGRARRLGAAMKHPRTLAAAADQATVDAARESAAATSLDVAAAIPLGEALADARDFVTCLCMEGMETSDHRFIAVDAIRWRPLPLTITAQLKTSDGHNDAVVAGRIDSIEKMPAAAALSAGLIPADRDYPPDAVAVIGRGPFANTWEGDEAMSLVADRMLRGVSVELAVCEGELLELPPEPGEDYGTLLDVTTDAEIASACIVAFPAFAEAQIMLASQADEGGLPVIDAPEDEAAEGSGEPEGVTASGWRFRVIVAAPIQMTRVVQLATRAGRHAYAAVDYSGGSMVAVHPQPDEAAACAQPGGQGSGEMHVTLAHLPNPDGVDFAALNKLVAKVAADHPAVDGHVGGAGYFAAAEQKGIPAKAEAQPSGPAPTGPAAEAAPAVAAAAALASAPAPPETDGGGNGAPATAESPDGGSPEDTLPPALHPHVALVDAPGLSKMRANLCQAMDDAGVEYSQNHDFTPHMTLGYEPEAATPAVHLAGQPLSFSHITVHEGLNQTAHPMQGGDALTASAAGAAPVKPPSEWFDHPIFDEPTPFTVTSDGQVFGHIATWGQCHVGLQDACVRPPRNQSGYRMFHLGEVETAEGDFIPVGSLTLDSGHADLRLNAAATKRHYDDTGVAAVDCVVGEDAHGIWIAGAVRPDLSMSQVRKLRASKPSGDWRTVGGSFEMIGIAAVNTPGFPVPRPKARVLAASGADGQRVTALVAAGIDLRPSDSTETRPAELYRLLDRAIPGSSAERLRALAASALG